MNKIYKSDQVKVWTVLFLKPLDFLKPKLIEKVGLSLQTFQEKMMKSMLLLLPFFYYFYELPYSKVKRVNEQILFDQFIYIYNATVFMWSKNLFFCLFILGFSSKDTEKLNKPSYCTFLALGGHSFGASLYTSIYVMDATLMQYQSCVCRVGLKYG